MSNPEISPPESDPGYAAAKEYCDFVIETREMFEDVSRRSLTIETIEHDYPGVFKRLRKLGRAAVGYPVQGLGGDRYYIDSDNPHIVDIQGSHNYGEKGVPFVGAIGEVDVKDLRMFNGAVILEMLMFRFDPVGSIADSEVREPYVNHYQKTNSNFINQPFGHFSKLPESAWIKFMDVRQLSPMSRHLKDPTT